MTPSLPDILMGQFIALTAPLPPEASGDYAAARLGMLAVLLLASAVVLTLRAYRHLGPVPTPVPPSPALPKAAPRNVEVLA